jgi:gamma-glutamyl:cysteine ligase YbdK (ATP-grasp superfamily)
MSESDEEKPGLHLFEGYGVEIELMIVERESLAVLPISDKLIFSVVGAYESEIERGPICWSNELVLHVIELKTNGPAPRLEGLAAELGRQVEQIDQLLEPLGGRLMPTAMHPWMDPTSETQLWPHEHSAVYETFDRMFGAGGHGWSNLQSVHLNLPFTGDDELARLHTAIRLVLPLLPALAASSPVVEGKPSGLLDSRMEYYRHNARRIPSVTGRVIPELALSKKDYVERILERIARDVAPHDRDQILDAEWVNARGAIVRFVRDSIEIRVIDVQECPAADVAVVALTVAAVRALVEERWMSFAEQQRFEVEDLERLLIAAIVEGERARVDDALAAAFGQSGAREAGALWEELARACLPERCEYWPALETIFTEGTLARRILRALEGAELARVYRELCDCLHEGRMFAPSVPIR